MSRHRDKLFELRFERRAYALDFNFRLVLIGVAHVQLSRPGPESGRWPGTVNLKVAPRPASDSTQIRPPLRSTIFLQSARPMPVPGTSLPCRRLNMPNRSEERRVGKESRSRWSPCHLKKTT